MNIVVIVPPSPSRTSHNHSKCVYYQAIPSFHSLVKLVWIVLLHAVTQMVPLVFIDLLLLLNINLSYIHRQGYTPIHHTLQFNNKQLINIKYHMSASLQSKQWKIQMYIEQWADGK